MNSSENKTDDRKNWDFGRFLQTLTDFDVIPFISPLSRLLQGKAPLPRPSIGAKSVGTILVIGTNSAIAQTLVPTLLNKGYSVRALDQLVVEDLTEPLFHNIQTIICCQENVSEDALKTLLARTQEYLQNSGEKVIFDFTQPSEDLKSIWGAVDDVVMGGVSQSNLQLVEETALFSGYVSTTNSGGFASVRTRNLSPALDLTGYQGISLFIQGDGQRYKFFLRSESAWDSLAYSYSFNTLAHQWMEVKVPFTELVPVFRAKTVNNAPALNTQQIHSLQLMLSKFEYDGQLNPHFNPGGFALQLQTIKAYGGTDSPQFIYLNFDSSLEKIRLNLIHQSGISHRVLNLAHKTPSQISDECLKFLK